MLRSYLYNPDGTIECGLSPERFRVALTSEQVSRAVSANSRCPR